MSLLADRVVALAIDLDLANQRRLTVLAINLAKHEWKVESRTHMDSLIRAVHDLLVWIAKGLLLVDSLLNRVIILDSAVLVVQIPLNLIVVECDIS